MELGQRLRQARMEAGLSQRQLCGDAITRNMLSQIENGTARPSMDTLAYLARQLGKPISFFLEEQAVTSPNQAVMEAARDAYRAGAHSRVLDILADYREPDPVFDQERYFLLAVCQLRLAEQAVLSERRVHALELLERCARSGARTAYYTPELEQKRLVLMASVRPELAAELAAEDGILLARAALALQRGDPARAAQYLDAAEDRTGPRWSMLRGECCFGLKEYEAAARCFHQAEAALSGKAIPWLEQCYKELGDYKRAYEYACMRRSNAD